MFYPYSTEDSMLISLQATNDIFFMVLAIDAAIVANMEFEGFFHGFSCVA